MRGSFESSFGLVEQRTHGVKRVQCLNRDAHRFELCPLHEMAPPDSNVIEFSLDFVSGNLGVGAL